MSKKNIITLSIIIGAILLYFFVFKKWLKKNANLSLYPFMKGWSVKKIETFINWYKNRYSIHVDEWKGLSSAERMNEAETRYYSGNADVISDGGFWNKEFNKYWAKVMEAQKLDYNGKKL